MTMPNQPWLPSPASPTLSPNEVHVWRTVLDQSTPRIQNLARILSTDEHMRAARFHFERDKRRFTVARGVLRTILGQYLDIEPSRLRFSYGSQGKPYLAERHGDEILRFNLAHSHELVLYAFTYGREIGIDLEYIRPMSDMEGIATRFFSAKENAVLAKIPKNQKVEAFFNCWTRKEAYIKARGEGLSMPLDEFDVSLTPGERATLIRVKKEPQEVARWSLQALDPAPDYVGALAVEGHGWHLTRWQWSA